MRRCLVVFLLLASLGYAQTPPAPWANSEWVPPPGYHGPTFKLSYKYPTRLPSGPADPPWIKALHGKPLSYNNSIAYVQALKDYITPAMKTLLLDYPHWDADREHWYNLPWLASMQDPIHGTYTGLNFTPSVFPLSHMTQPQMSTQMIVYYNDIAAYTLGQVWGASALDPKLEKCQFPEGSIIVKGAFTTALADDWSPMENSIEWEIYPPVINSDGSLGKPVKAIRVALMQFDIIVKDTKAAPKTGWVFATLVYDKNAPGKDGWDKMIPMGAMWGNDPEILSAYTPNVPLEENVISPQTPLYATETLGYGDRLSGPNDGGVSEGNMVDGKFVPRMRVSSCMSCHGSAQWPMTPPMMEPGLPANDPTVDPSMNLNAFYPPGSTEWNEWFQNRPGNVPQNPEKGVIALDYDMNIAIKALPVWWAWKQTQVSITAGLGDTPTDQASKLLLSMPAFYRKALEHPGSIGTNGKPLKSPTGDQ